MFFQITAGCECFVTIGTFVYYWAMSVLEMIPHFAFEMETILAFGALEREFIGFMMALML